MKLAKLAVLLSFSGAGGVERMVLNLLHGLIAQGLAVDVLAIRAGQLPHKRLPHSAQLRVIDLGVNHTALALPALLVYLRRERPQVLLAAKDRAIRLAVRGVRVARLSGLAKPLPVVGRLGTHLSTALAARYPLERAFRLWPMQRIYPRIDQIIAVSQGVADDIIQLTAIDPARVAVVHNPVIMPDLSQLAARPAPHPWFYDGGAPVILGVGRLTAQKDFATLLRAFAQLVKQHQQPARLLILGEGRDRSSLTELACQLGVAAQLEMPGFVDNPYSYMARAAVFVLSSRWEGSPNVLTEALAVGTPVVSTDCPSGPREILLHGQIAPLVKVGDSQALAAALAATLAAPPNAAGLRAAASTYRLENSSQAYITLFNTLLERSAKPNPTRSDMDSL